MLAINLRNPVFYRLMISGIIALSSISDTFAASAMPPATTDGRPVLDGSRAAPHEMSPNITARPVKIEYEDPGRRDFVHPREDIVYVDPGSWTNIYCHVNPSLVRFFNETIPNIQPPNVEWLRFGSQDMDNRNKTLFSWDGAQCEVYHNPDFWPEWMAFLGESQRYFFDVQLFNAIPREHDGLYYCIVSFKDTDGKLHYKTEAREIRVLVRETNRGRRDPITGERQPKRPKTTTKKPVMCGRDIKRPCPDPRYITYKPWVTYAQDPSGVLPDYVYVAEEDGTSTAATTSGTLPTPAEVVNSNESHDDAMNPLGQKMTNGVTDPNQDNIPLPAPSSNNNSTNETPIPMTIPSHSSSTFATTNLPPKTSTVVATTVSPKKSDLIVSSTNNGIPAESSNEKAETTEDSSDEPKDATEDDFEAVLPDKRRTGSRRKNRVGNPQQPISAKVTSSVADPTVLPSVDAKTESSRMHLPIITASSVGAGIVLVLLSLAVIITVKRRRFKLAHEQSRHRAIAAARLAREKFA